MPEQNECVIFDLDGVLIDSRDAHYESWCRLARKLGTQVSREMFARTFGRQNRDIIPMMFEGQSGARRIEELSELKESYYREIVADSVRPIPGAADLVRSCHADGLKCAVGSSGHPLNIRSALQSLGIHDLMNAIVSGKDVSAGKPDPQVFLVAAKNVGVEPDRCAVIEDAPAGVEAALAAGMVAVAITTEHPRSRLDAAHLVIDRMSELSPQIVRRLTRTQA